MSTVRAEIDAMLRLALPLVLSMVGSQAMVTTDVLMVGRLGPEALAANGLGFQFYSTLFLFGLGVGSAVGGLLAQAYGAQDADRLRSTTAQAFWVVFLVSVPMIALLWNADAILVALGQDAGIAALSRTYLLGVAPTYLIGLWINVLNGLFATSGRARLVMTVTWVGVVLNAGLDWLLIYGNLGFPRLELFGSGLATTLVNLAMLVVLATVAGAGSAYRPLRIFRRIHVVEPRRVLEILRVGVPAGATMMMKTGLFAFMALVVGWIGTVELAAFGIALPFLVLTFMVPMGLSQAALVRVGNAHGAGDPAGVRRAGLTGLALVLAVMVVYAALMLTIPEAIAGLYVDRDDPASVPVVAAAAGFLTIAALYQFGDGVQVMMLFALRGVSDTRVPMWIAFASYWGVAAGAGYLLALPLGIGADGVWYGLVLGISLMAAGLTVRFLVLTRRAATSVALGNPG